MHCIEPLTRAAGVLDQMGCNGATIGGCRCASGRKKTALVSRAPISRPPAQPSACQSISDIEHAQGRSASDGNRFVTKARSNFALCATMASMPLSSFETAASEKNTDQHVAGNVGEPLAATV